MLKKAILMLCTLSVFSSTFAATDSDSELAADTGIMLLNVVTEGPLSVRDIVFTHTLTGEEVRIRNIQNLSRHGKTRYLMEEVPAGQYYLSSIYPSYNVDRNAPRIQLEESSGIITILSGTINYIGDVIITSREMGRGITTKLDYQSNSATLMSAVARERSKFMGMDTVVSIAGNKPVRVDRKLLGL